MRLYLAGPMRGIPDNNAAAFAEAAARLRSLGHEVWSPSEEDARLGVDAENADLRAVFRRDLEALLGLDGIVLLPGWARSHGACLECHAADVCGLSVFIYYPLAATAIVPTRTQDWRDVPDATTARTAA